MSCFFLTSNRGREEEELMNKEHRSMSSLKLKMTETNRVGSVCFSYFYSFWSTKTNQNQPIPTSLPNKKTKMCVRTQTLWSRLKQGL